MFISHPHRNERLNLGKFYSFHLVEVLTKWRIEFTKKISDTDSDYWWEFESEELARAAFEGIVKRVGDNANRFHDTVIIMAAIQSVSIEEDSGDFYISVVVSFDGEVEELSFEYPSAAQALEAF